MQRGEQREMKNLKLSTQKCTFQYSSVRKTSKRLSFCSNAGRRNSKSPNFKGFDYENY